MDWISVKDRLPDINSNVIVAWGTTPDNITMMRYTAYPNAKNQYGRMPRFEWNGGMRSPWVVTHWMPLPAPPEEKGEVLCK